MEFLKSWQFFALGSAVFAALTAIFGKIGVSNVDSNLATFFRTIVILLVSGLFVTGTQAWSMDFFNSKRTLVFLILSGICTGLSWLCYYHALQLGPASKVAPVDKLSVVFVILLSALFLSESLSWKVILGASLITAGSVVILL